MDAVGKASLARRGADGAPVGPACAGHPAGAPKPALLLAFAALLGSGKGLALSIASLLMVALSAQADMAVIVNVKNTTSVLTAKEVQDIFLGRARAFPNGRFAMPIDQSPLRAEFYQAITSRPVEQIDAYWARLMFSGRASPPAQLADDAAVLETVRKDEAAIGYIDAKRVNPSVRSLLLLKKAAGSGKALAPQQDDAGDNPQ